MFLSISQASRALGTSVSTLRRWEQEGTMSATYRTSGGHRRYSLRVLQDNLGLISGVASRITIAYARVSSSDQKEDRYPPSLEDTQLGLPAAAWSGLRSMPRVSQASPPLALWS